MLEHISSEHFMPLIDKPCELLVEQAELAVTTTVLSVKEYPKALPSDPKPGQNIPFSVLLRGPLDPSFNWAMCNIRGEGLPVLENIMVNRIVPVDSEPGAYYQIVFN